MNDPELILHERSKKQFEMFKKNLPQSLIIDGPQGVGVLRTANELATYFNATTIYVAPKKKVKTDYVIDHSEGNVIIDDIRQLYEQTKVRQNRIQIFIIDTGLRSMTVQAQNAFLKLLEEPRRGVHFIIVTHHIDQLLPTIQSRSQRLTLLPVSKKQTIAVIESLANTDKLYRTRLAFVGQGLPGLIYQLANDHETYEKRIAIMSDAKTLLGDNSYEKLKVIHKYKDRRGDAITLIDDMNKQLRTVIGANPDIHIAQKINSLLDLKDKIYSNGNIRLQLASTLI